MKIAKKLLACLLSTALILSSGPICREAGAARPMPSGKPLGRLTVDAPAQGETTLRTGALPLNDRTMPISPLTTHDHPLDVFDPPSTFDPADVRTRGIFPTTSALEPEPPPRPAWEVDTHSRDHGSERRIPTENGQTSHDDDSAPHGQPVRHHLTQTQNRVSENGANSPTVQNSRLHTLYYGQKVWANSKQGDPDIPYDPESPKAQEAKEAMERASPLLSRLGLGRGDLDLGDVARLETRQIDIVVAPNNGALHHPSQNNGAFHVDTELRTLHLAGTLWDKLVEDPQALAGLMAYATHILQRRTAYQQPDAREQESETAQALAQERLVDPEGRLRNAISDLAASPTSIQALGIGAQAETLAFLFESALKGRTENINFLGTFEGQWNRVRNRVSAVWQEQEQRLRHEKTELEKRIKDMDARERKASEAQMKSAILDNVSPVDFNARKYTRAALPLKARSAIVDHGLERIAQGRERMAFIDDLLMWEKSSAGSSAENSTFDAFNQKGRGFLTTTEYTDLLNHMLRMLDQRDNPQLWQLFVSEVEQTRAALGKLLKYDPLLSYFENRKTYTPLTWLFREVLREVSGNPDLEVQTHGSPDLYAHPDLMAFGAFVADWASGKVLFSVHEKVLDYWLSEPILLGLLEHIPRLEPHLLSVDAQGYIRFIAQILLGQTPEGVSPQDARGAQNALLDWGKDAFLQSAHDENPRLEEAYQEEKGNAALKRIFFLGLFLAALAADLINVFLFGVNEMFWHHLPGYVLLALAARERLTNLADWQHLFGWRAQKAFNYTEEPRIPLGMRHEIERFVRRAGFELHQIYLSENIQEPRAWVRIPPISLPKFKGRQPIDVIVTRELLRRTLKQGKTTTLYAVLGRAVALMQNRSLRFVVVASLGVWNLVDLFLYNLLPLQGWENWALWALTLIPSFFFGRWLFNRERADITGTRIAWTPGTPPSKTPGKLAEFYREVLEATARGDLPIRMMSPREQADLEARAERLESLNLGK